MSESSQLALRLLGEIEVIRDGQLLPLPASRKARALLVYLAVTRQAHRRDRLCTMLWDLPDDPRGALRSSLTRLRPIVDTVGRRRILAERDAVRLDVTDVEIDLFTVQRVLRRDGDSVATEELEYAASLFRGELAEGLDLANCPDFHAWRLAEREEARRMHVRILRTLIERHAGAPEAALAHGRVLAQIDATASAAHITLLRLLIASGRPREAEEQREMSMRLLGEVGGTVAHEFAAAWRSLAARPAISDRREGPSAGVGESAGPRSASEGFFAATGPTPGASAAAGSERPHIAVLPFTNMSDAPGQEYFADGITEDIITDLSRASALFVVPRNTAFTYKGRAVEIAEVAQRLKVGYVLQGSVRKVADRVRVNVQLIDGATGDHLWSARYDRGFGDIFALQDDISRSVVLALKVSLLPQESESIADRATTNAEAYERYLHGRSFLFGGFGDKHSLREARALFSQAIQIDPGYARAYAGIAECDSLLWIAGAGDISYEEILRNSNTALAFAPNMAEAHASRGLALFLSGHADAAIAAFERALELDPELFEGHEWYGEVCRNTGQYTKAAALFERPAELRPTDYISLMILRDCYDSLGLHEQAVAAARRAIVRVEAQLVKWPKDAMAWSSGAATLVSLGESRKAEAWAERALLISPEDYVVHYNAACTYAVTGRVDAALERLEHVFSHTPRVRSWLLGIAKHDVQLDALRGRREFQDLMRRLEQEAAATPDRTER